MAPKQILLLLLFLGLSFIPNLKTQTITFNEKDTPFFDQKSVAYQRWLDKTGLGAALQVTKLRLKKDSTELEMLLRVNATDLDSAIALWNRCKDDYHLATGQDIEEKLFWNFSSFMEIPPAQGNVQVYVLDSDGAYIPCFYVGIWEENGSIRWDSKIRECKDKPLDIQLKPLVLTQTTRGKTTEIKKARTSEDVFNSIMAFLSGRYGAVNCHDRKPEIEEESRNETSMRVSISDLCRVVLTDEKESMWCRGVKLLGWDCNDVRRERLEFEFTYATGSDRISGKLTGKFGSGVYRPRKSGYMDMEPDFNDYLDDFHRKFQLALKAYLEKP